jgi:hypothetical protein
VKRIFQLETDFDDTGIDAYARQHGISRALAVAESDAQAERLLKAALPPRAVTVVAIRTFSEC